MSKQWRTWISFFCLYSLAVPAQPSDPANQSAGADSQVITIYATAKNKAGRPISGLGEQDFTLLDNKHKQKIVSFQAVEGATADLPVEVILLVDEVNESLANVAYGKAQVAKFLQTNGGQLPAPVSLVFFTDSGAAIGSKPSRDGTALLAELNRHRTPLHTIFSSQGIYAASERFELSLRAIEQLTAYEATRPGRKLLVWISPGWPLLDFQPTNATDNNRQQILRTVVGLSSRLRDAGITLYNVDPLGTSDSEGLRTVRYKEFLPSLKDSSQAAPGNLGLQVLAYQSGGRVLTSSNDIASEIAECVSDADTFYVLSFQAATADGPNDYHSLEIKIDKPGVSARTRSGYYAEQLLSQIQDPLAAFEDHELTGGELVDLVSKSLNSDHDDKSMAERLNKIDLTEQLSAQTLSELQRLGIGPLALSALEKLRQRSASLIQPPDVPISSQSARSEEDKNQMVERLVSYAREYVHNLPNFICDQITKRYTNLDGFARNGNPKYSARLHYGDTITAGLAFASGIQRERVTLASNEDMRFVEPREGQSLSNGEFGRDMALILGVKMDPELKWDRWETLQGNSKAVFTYFVPLAKTEYSLLYCCFRKPGVGEVQQSFNAPIRGSIYVDPATGVISRLVIKAVDLPSTFHIKENNTIIDYNKVSIGGRQYTLPVTANIFVRADLQKNRNEIAFVRYKKFEPESIFTTVNSQVTYKK